MVEQAAGMSGQAQVSGPGLTDDHGVSGQTKIGKKRSGRSGASPKITDARTRSHFGVSTQMIVDDAGPDLESGNLVYEGSEIQRLNSRFQTTVSNN